MIPAGNKASFVFGLAALALVLVLRSPTAAASTLSDDAATVHARLLAQFAPTDAAAAAASAEKYLSALQSNGSWSDVDYHSQTRGDWSPETHMSRVTTMAQAVRFGNLTQDGQATMLKGVRAALDFWQAHDFQSIGIPTAFSHTVLLLDGVPNALTADELAFANTDMARADPSGWTGANLVWMEKVLIVRGLVFNHIDHVTESFKRLWQEIYWAHQPEDNIQRDSSFHQHSGAGHGMFLPGSYGEEFTADLLALLDAARGTMFAPNTTTLAIFVSLILDGQQWYTTQNAAWDWTVVGRGNSNPGSSRVTFESEFLRHLPLRQAEINNYVNLLTNVPSQPLLGNRHYYDSDYMVHRRADYMVSVHMYSSRTLPARCVNSQGKKNSRIGDGVTSIYVTGDEYLDIFPVWDFRQLPGTTEELDTPLLPCAGYNSWITELNYTTFVGGASDGLSGVAAMDLWSFSLHKHGAWFFGEDSFVHLGAGIHCATPTTDAGTTLANHLLAGAVSVQMQGQTTTTTLTPGNHTLNGVSLVFHARYAGGTRGTAYLPLDAATAVLEVALLNRTGDWSALGTASGNITRPVLTVLARHGACPLANVSVAYAVLPNTTLSEAVLAAAELMRSAGAGSVQGYTGAQTVLTNTEALQAVRSPAVAGGTLTQAVFWNASATLEGVARVSAPALLQLRVAGNGQTVVALSSPTVVGNVTVSLLGARAGSGATCVLAGGQGAVAVESDGSSLTFTLPGGDWLGQSQVANCTSLPVLVSGR